MSLDVRALFAQLPAASRHPVPEILQRSEAPFGRNLADQRPQALCRLQIRRVRRQLDQVKARRFAERSLSSSR